MPMYDIPDPCDPSKTKKIHISLDLTPERFGKIREPLTTQRFSLIARLFGCMIGILVITALLYGLLQLITWGDAHLVLRDPHHPYRLRASLFLWVGCCLWWGTLIGYIGLDVIPFGIAQLTGASIVFWIALASVVAFAFLDRSLAERVFYGVGTIMGAFVGLRYVTRSYYATLNRRESHR